MLLNQNFSFIDETIPFYSSSDSSCSETLDVKNSGSEIKKQWEAIERTLYQEEGEEVTDPEILKECKLWRETFPHFRVRGTKIEVNKGNGIEEVVENEKNIQTIDGHINLSKIRETREKIKSRVVGELVGRLVAKFNLNKEIESYESSRFGGHFNGGGGVQITEIHDESPPKTQSGSQVRKSKEESNADSIIENGIETILPKKPETEFYFERGKSGKKADKKEEEEEGELSRKKIEDRLNDIFDSLENNSSNIKRITPSELMNKIKGKNSPSGDFDYSKVEKEGDKLALAKVPGRPNNNRRVERFRTDSLSNQIKPFEATKKIDKKYEGLLKKIMERTSLGESGENCQRHCQNAADNAVFRRRTDPSKTRLASPEKLLREIKSEFDEFCSWKSKNNYKILPGIKKSETNNNNKWLERGQIHALDNARDEGFFLRELQRPTTTKKTVKFSEKNPPENFRLSGEIFTRSELDENSMREFKLGMESIYRRRNSSTAKSDFFEEGLNNSRRRKLSQPPGNVKKTLKSSSCGDLPNNNDNGRKNVSRTGVRQQSGNGFETSAKRETMVKSRTRFTNPLNGKSIRSNSNNRHSSILPPIETGDDENVGDRHHHHHHGDSKCEFDGVNSTDLIREFKSKWPVEEWKKFGLFDEDYLLRINEYWMKFPPPSPSSHYLFGAVYAFIMLVGTVGNFLIIIMLLRKPSLRTPSNVFILNLAVSDALLLLKMPLFIFNSIYLGPALGNLGCSTYGFLGGLTGTVSIMTLAAISFDRYQMIVYPLERKTKSRIYLQIILIWLYGGFFSTIPLLDVGLNKYVPEGYLTSCSFDYLNKDLASRITVFVFFVAAWIVPLCIILGSYLGLYKVIFRARNCHLNNMTRHCKEIEIRRPELKAAVTVVCVVSLWTLSWTPYAVVALLGVTGNEKYLTPISSMIPALFCKTASCIDPFVYAVTTKRFRNELKCKRRRNSTYQESFKKKKKNFLSISKKTVARARSTKRDTVNEITVLATSM